MRKKTKEREQVEILPDGALTVANYALSYGCTTPYIYELESKGKVKIVRWQGINWVVGNVS